MKKTNVKNIKKTTKQLPLAIGSFDIIHKGHWNLLKKVIGKEFNVLLIINSPKTNTYFNTTEQRINNIATLNPKNIYVFDVKKNNYSDQVFINKVLKHINPSQIIVGSNFKFGKNASGTIDKLIKKFNVLVIDAKKYRTKDIKDLYLKSRVDEANSKVILPIAYEGKIVKCKQYGRTYGFPTLNLIFNDKNLITPPTGIYASIVYLNDKAYFGATYVNKNNKQTLIETNVIKKVLPYNLYGRTIKVRLLKYVKPTEKIKHGNQKNYVASMVKLVEKFFSL